MNQNILTLIYCLLFALVIPAESHDFHESNWPPDPISKERTFSNSTSPVLVPVECFRLKAPVIAVPAAQKTCVPIKVDGFYKFDYLKFTIEWSGLVHFDSLTNFHPSFGANPSAGIDSTLLSSGKMGIQILHNPAAVLSDNTTLFEVCIDGSTLAGTSSPICFGPPLTGQPYVTSEGKPVGLRYFCGEVAIDNGTPNDLAFTEGCINFTACDPMEGTIDITTAGGIGPYSYSWTGPGNFALTSEDIPSSTLSEGFYTVVVTDLSDGSTRTASFEIIKPMQVSRGHFLEHVSCLGGNDGSIEVKYADDAITLDYLWSTANTSPTITGLGAGVYGLTVVNDLGCTTEQEFIIHEPSGMSIDLAISYCSATGQGDGDVDLNITGGIYPYSVQWNDGLLTQGSQRVDLPAGMYDVTISDALGCELPINNIEVVDGDGFTLVADTAICIGDSVDLFVHIPPNATMVSFFPETGVSCSPCTPPFKVAPGQTTTYEVRMEDTDCIYFETVTILVDSMCMWPGDTDTNKVVSHFDLLNIGLAHGSNGPLRPNANITWTPQPGLNWPQQTPNSLVNYKHVDCDGNGLIDDMDTLAITQNWGEMHNLAGGGGSQKLPVLPFQINASGTLPFYIEADTLIENRRYDLPIILGEATQPATDVYGLGFTLVYDGDVIVPGSAHVNFESSWLGSSGELLFIQRSRLIEGKVDVAVTRRDGLSMDGFGQLGIFSITIEDDIFLNGGGGSDRLLNGDREIIFNIEDVRIISSEEEEIIANPSPTRTFVGMTTGLNDNYLLQQMDIFPNPVSSQLHIVSQVINIEKLSVYNGAGINIKEQLVEGEKSIINCADLTPGVYWLKIETAEGVALQKLTVQR